MNCQEVMELMQRHLDEDLQEREEKELYAHLLHCPDCAEMFERLQGVSDGLTQLPKVVAPYSLVDAILPQLAELDKYAASSNSEPKTGFGKPTLVGNQSAKPPRTRRSGSHFSWKLVSGVVAAGIMIGFFAFDLKHPVQNQADGMLQPKTTTESSDVAQMADPTVHSSPSATGSNSMMKGADTHDVQEPSKVADGSANAKGAGQATVPPQSQETPGVRLDKPQQIDPSHAAVSTPQVSPSVNQTPEISEPEKMNPPATQKKGDGVVQGPSDSSATAPATENPSQDGTASRKAPAEATTSPSAASINSQDIQSQKVGEQALQSVTGTFEAVVEKHHVVVRDSSSQKVVFVSKQQWKEADTITLLEWSKDDKLSYEVVSGGSSKTFVIDLKKKKEISP